MRIVWRSRLDAEADGSVMIGLQKHSEGVVLLGVLLYNCLASLSYAQFDLSDPCSSTAIQLHDGDIAYFPSHITVTNPDESPGDSRGERAATSEYYRVWPDGKVYYTISPLYSAAERRTVQRALQHWETHTCIRFLPRSPTDHDYINLFPGSGCCSYIGRIGYGLQGVSIGRGCFSFENVVHEIGHVVGFWHEQSRPDRDEYVDVLEWNIRVGYEVNFLKLHPSLVDSYGVGYDYNSIMHYNRNFFSINYGYDTLQAKDPAIPIGQAVELSQLDIIQANHLYNCDVDNPPALSVTVPAAPSEPIFPEVPYSCVEYLQNLTGTIQSPGYPEYRHNTQCAWLIKLPRGYQLSVEVSVQIEYSAGCSKDYLRFWKNLDQSDNYVEFCGLRNPYRYILQNTAYFYYYTDSYNAHDNGMRGFTVTYTATDINECINRPCSFGCRNIPGSYECFCRDGFYLSADGKTCFDVNECALGNGGCTHTCVNRAGFFYCTCDTGYTLDEDGRICRTFESSCNYLNGGCSHICVQETDSRTCTCNQGYRLDGNGHSCHEINECFEPTNNCDHYCYNTDGSFYCSCRTGFSLHSNGYNCIPEYSCNIDNGGCNQICRDTSNGAVCSCISDGYTLNGRTCEDINECTRRRACQHSCINTEGSYECICREGYSLASNDYSCQNINECALGTHACEFAAYCYDSTGSYYCGCPHGYTLGTDGHSCDDLDECNLGIRFCEHECVNIPGSYVCRCPPGYTLFDYTICLDTNECVDDHGGCDHLCSNSEGSFTCSCRSGYTLAADGISCTLPTTEPPATTSPSPTTTSSPPPTSFPFTEPPSSPDPQTGRPSTLPTTEPPATTSPSPTTTSSPPPTSFPFTESPSSPDPQTGRPSTLPTTEPPATTSPSPTTTSSPPPTSFPFTESPSSPDPQTGRPSTLPTEPPTTTSPSPTTTSSPPPTSFPFTESPSSPDPQTGRPATSTRSPSPTAPTVQSETLSSPTAATTQSSNHTLTTSTTQSVNPTDALPPSCGGTLRSESGFFYTPNWPRTYPINTTCEWTIILPDVSSVILITFNSITYGIAGNMPRCVRDTLVVMDGLQNDDNVFGPFCSLDVPNPITTTSNMAKIRFVAGPKHSRSRKGFYATYTSTQPPTATSPPSASPTTSQSQCGGYLTALTGSLNSPNWPETYPIDTECEWFIVLSDNSKVINITFDSAVYSFPGTASRCKKDWVAIIDGLDSDAIIGTFCYVIAPDPIITSSFLAKILFRSGPRHTQSRKGFSITYRSMDAP